MTDDTPTTTTPQKAPQVAPNPDNIVVVLSRTTEPMNIGAACRAMKTMGLKHLRLIAPLNPKGRSARALAHGAEDILEAAVVVDDLMDAVGDCIVVTGTTARERMLRKHALLAPDALADRVAAHSAEGKVAVMFGTERTGLTNDEVDICRYLSTVDTAPEQPSLNLAQAVMLYGWEIRQAVQRAAAAAAPPVVAPRRAAVPTEMRVNHPHLSTRLPTQHQLDSMYAHLAHAMTAIRYTDRERLKFLTYLRQLHMRAGIVDWETHIYHILARKILRAVGAPKFPGLDAGSEDEPDSAENGPAKE